MDNILEIRNLRKEYKGFVLENISFSLPRGYIMGLIGPNGAGKTTTIKLIMNLIHRSGGEIKIFGVDPQRHGKEIKQKIGFVYDESFYFEDLNADGISTLMKRFYHEWQPSRFQAFLTDFKLPARKKIKDYSRGMKTKLSLAVALSHNADLILMDEPTSGLDPVFRHEILEILGNIIQDESKAILFSSHITSDLERIADYVTFIQEGKIVFSENKDDVLGRFSVIQGPVSDLTPGLEAQLLGLRKGSFGFEGLCPAVDEASRHLSNQCVIERASLDQIMVFFARDTRRVNREMNDAGADA
jgi:ABC-2 type transport system ATP-binding protein